MDRQTATIYILSLNQKKIGEVMVMIFLQMGQAVTFLAQLVHSTA